MELLAPWAKRSRVQPDVHHPLLFHMLDVGLVAQVLWDHALGRNFKRQFHSLLGLAPEEAATLISFWAWTSDGISETFEVSLLRFRDFSRSCKR